MTLKEQQQEFSRYIRTGVPTDLGNISAQRMAVYRRLFWGNIEGYLSKILCQTARCVSEEQWQKLLQKFFAEAEMTSPIYRDLPAEFIAWASGQTTVDLPPYWLELAHFEALQTALVFAPDNASSAWLQPCAVAGYSYPVHLWQTGVVLQPAASFVAVYRTVEDKVKWLVLTPVQARFIELAQQTGLSLDEATTQLKRELPQLQDIDQALERLRTQGIIRS